MTAGELMDLPSIDSTHQNKSLSQDSFLHENKLEESKIGSENETHGYMATPDEETLYNSIKKNGVRSPVSLQFYDDTDTPYIDNGNHRVASANDINPNMYVPIDYLSLSDKWKLGMDLS